MSRSFKLSALLISFTILALIAVGAFAAGTDTELGSRKKRTGPPKSVNLLLRDELKKKFKTAMNDYFAENKAAYLSHFTDPLTMVSRTLAGKAPECPKEDLAKRLDDEFKGQDFTKVKFEDAFDFSSPSMVFVLSAAEMKSAIPVWPFTTEAKEIAQYMKPDDFLVIANTKPELMEKEISLPSCLFMIMRKVDNKLYIAGID